MSSRAEELLTEARTYAGEAAWARVSGLVDAADAELEAEPELAVLWAEAEIHLGNLRSARAALEAAIPRLERRGDAVGLRRAVNVLGAACFELGELGLAEEAFERALEMANAAGDHLTMARATNNLGMIANIRGAHDQALALYRVALPAYQRIGNSKGLAESYHNIAITYRDLRQYEEAERHQVRAIEFGQECQNGWVLAKAQAGRAELSLLRGEPEVAQAGARMAAEAYSAIPDPVGEADSLRLAGRACLALGSIAAAREALDRAVCLAREHGSALIEAESLRARAEVYARVGEWERLRGDARAAEAIFARLGAETERVEVEAWLAEVVEGRSLQS